MVDEQDAVTVWDPTTEAYPRHRDRGPLVVAECTRVTEYLSPQRRPSIGYIGNGFTGGLESVEYLRRRREGEL